MSAYSFEETSKIQQLCHDPRKGVCMLVSANQLANLQRTLLKKLLCFVFLATTQRRLYLLES